MKIYLNQSSKLDFRIYWPENFLNIYIDSIEKIWQKSLVRINFHWPWASGPLLKSMTVESLISERCNEDIFSFNLHTQL